MNNSPLRWGLCFGGGEGGYRGRILRMLRCFCIVLSKELKIKLMEFPAKRCFHFLLRSIFKRDIKHDCLPNRGLTLGR